MEVCWEAQVCLMELSGKYTGALTGAQLTSFRACRPRPPSSSLTTGPLHSCRIISFTVQFQWPHGFPSSKFSYFFTQTLMRFTGFQVQMMGRASDWPSWVGASPGTVTHAFMARGAVSQEEWKRAIWERMLYYGWIQWCVHHCHLGYTLGQDKDYYSTVGGELPTPCIWIIYSTSHRLCQLDSGPRCILGCVPCSHDSEQNSEKLILLTHASAFLGIQLNITNSFQDL